MVSRCKNWPRFAARWWLTHYKCNVVLCVLRFLLTLRRPIKRRREVQWASLSLFSHLTWARLKSIRERYLIKWREEQFAGKSLILGSAFRSPILDFPGRADYFLFIDFISAVRVRRPPCGWSPPTSSEPVLSLGRSGQFLLMCLTQRRDKNATVRASRHGAIIFVAKLRFLFWKRFCSHHAHF